MRDEGTDMPVLEEPIVKKPWAVRALPPFPPVALQLLDILSKDDLMIENVVRLVRMDPAFSGEILKVANSAAYGFRTQIDSLAQAIVLLGSERIKALTITAAMGIYAKRAFRNEALRKAWHHSLACAFLAEEMAHACSVNKDRAYTAGLMHDIGRMALLVGFPDEYSTLIEVTKEHCINVLEVERAMFDIDHCEAGRHLARDWKLPEEMRDIIADHHTEKLPSPINLKALICLSCRLADSLGFHAMQAAEVAKFEEVSEQLPSAVRPCFDKSPDQLTAEIRVQVQSFG